MEIIKVRQLLDKASAEVKTEEEEQIIALIKTSLKAVKDCRKTLQKLEKKHSDLLETDISELELQDWQY